MCGPNLGHTKAPTKYALSHGAKWPEREAHYSYPSSGELRFHVSTSLQYILVRVSSLPGA